MSQVVEEKKVKHIVGFSGGIDSQATARWVLNRYPKEDVILLNSDAGGNEHPITTEFIEKYSENVHPVIVVSPLIMDIGERLKKGKVGERRSRYSECDLMTFDRLAEIKGMFPSSQMQFCTQYLKLKPQHRWIKENIIQKGFSFSRYSGVRRQESKKRSEKQAVEWDDYFGCPLHHPIVDWTKQMCFDYCKHHGEEVNPLYKMGFSRVGCAPCINANKKDIFEWATRFPEMIDKVREWEKRTGFSFFRMPREDGSYRFVDDVVDWSKTMRGGKQYSLMVLQEPAACDSDYGLCE
jgi:3'-phosphoadenosine 5'-phosphosulfate sulfotransferase (PAPS reductase)/FAD synthetase